jgi:tetratricopeptide (TPR) repeat protein
MSMKILRLGSTMRALSSVVAFCFISFQLMCLVPATALADSARDLRTIEYKYYFRGNYEKAIEELELYLKRKDLGKAEIVEAREYLAASLILTGSSDKGKDQFLKLINADSSYEGPDPSVFKSIIVTTYKDARTEYASMIIKNAPRTEVAGSAASSQSPAATKKPIYKKWWFYVGVGAALILVAGAASSSGGDEGGTPVDTGSVTIEVDVR